MRVLHALLLCLPSRDIDTVLRDTHADTDTRARTHTHTLSDVDTALVRGAGAAHQRRSEEQAKAGSPAADRGGRSSAAQLVGALADVVLHGVGPCKGGQAQSAMTQSLDGAISAGLTQSLDDAVSAGMLAVECLHLVAGSSSAGSSALGHQGDWVGWGTASENTGAGVAVLAEDALLKGVLMGSSLGHSGFMWHSVQTAVLNLAAARPHAARRRYSDAVACAVRETLPSEMSAYARLSSLLLRIQALS